MRLAGRSLELTAREFELLHTFLSSPGRVFTREVLLAKLWGYDFFGDERVVDSHIKNLRHKLGIDCIETVRGWAIVLRRKLHESLTVRIFLITLLILLGAGAITFALIAWATPITYTAAASDDLRAQTDLLVERLSVTALEDCGPILDEFIRASNPPSCWWTPMGTSFRTPTPSSPSSRSMRTRAR